VLGRADQQLVDGHTLWARHDVPDGLSDVFHHQPLDARQELQHLLAPLFPQVAEDLSRHGTGLDHRDTHVPPGDLLAQRLAEGHHPNLGRRVHPFAAAGDPPSIGAHVDQIGDAAWAALPP
jgi:hypothetical protein